MKIAHVNRIVGVLRENELEDSASKLIGLALAYALECPTKPNENLFAFWSNNIVSKVNLSLDGLSQRQAFNQVEAFETAKELWFHRVTAFYSPQPECPELIQEIPKEWTLAMTEIIRILRIELIPGF